MSKQWITIDTEDVEHKINLAHIQGIRTQRNNNIIVFNFADGTTISVGVNHDEVTYSLTKRKYNELRRELPIV